MIKKSKIILIIFIIFLLLILKNDNTVILKKSAKTNHYNANINITGYTDEVLMNPRKRFYIYV